MLGVSAEDGGEAGDSRGPPEQQEQLQRTPQPCDQVTSAGVDTPGGSCFLNDGEETSGFQPRSDAVEKPEGAKESPKSIKQQQDPIFIPGVLGETVGYRYALGGILVYFEGCGAERAVRWAHAAALSKPHCV